MAATGFYSGKRVLITGGSSGIGEYLAYEFADQGAELVLASRNLSEMERVRKKIPAEVKVGIQFLDLSNHKLIEHVVKNILKEFGPIDVIVNSGGLSQRSLAIDTDFKVLKKIMDVNFFGTVELCRCFLPHFVKQGGAHLVIVSSLTGKFSTPYRSVYAASKHALHGYFDAVRAEMFKDNIDVTILCPGFVRTGLAKRALTGDGSENGKMDVTNYDGLSPKEFAEQAIVAIKKKKDEVYIGGKETWGIYIKRYFPWLFNRLIKNSAVK